MTTCATGLYYVYAKNINDDWSYRYLITFANRDVADTWFRLVTDSVAGGYPRFAAVKRVTPQFFTHDPGVGNIPDTITDAKVALELRGQIFFTLVNDRDGRILSVIPVLNYIDHVNGGSFYIRSVSHPETFWYYDAARGGVVASTTNRTRFTITIADTARAPGTLIISSDDIYISNNGVNIGIINQQDELGSSVNPFTFKFSSFGRDFQINTNGSVSSTNPGFIARNPGLGEGWELV